MKEKRTGLPNRRFGEESGERRVPDPAQPKGGSRQGQGDRREGDSGGRREHERRHNGSFNEETVRGLGEEQVLEVVQRFCAHRAEQPLNLTTLADARTLNTVLGDWEAWDGGRGGQGPYYRVLDCLLFAGLAFRAGTEEDKRAALSSLLDALDQASEYCV